MPAIYVQSEVAAPGCLISNILRVRKKQTSNAAKKLKKRPWEYFRDNFWVTFWYESIGPKQLLETTGVDKVLFETDYPHPTSLYPGVQEHIVDVLGGYSYEVKKKVLQTNAVTLYNLPF